MAAWGVGIFDDDLAQKARASFERHMRDGQSVYMAAESVLAGHAGLDGPQFNVVALAVAALQMELHTISPKVRKKALTVIISGEGAEAWEGGDPAALAAREQVLQALREQLREMHT
jgi:hypothetical protein